MTPCRLWLAACLGVLLVTPALEAADDKVRIRDVRVGFARGDDDYFKVGAWAPVTVDIESMAADFQGWLRVETNDGDGASSRNAIEIFVPRQSDREPFRTFVTYLKIGESSGTVQLYALDGNGKTVARFKYADDNVPYRPSMALRPETKIVLAITQPKWFDEANESATSLSRNFRVSFQTDVTRLPEHWFGYEGVEAVILPTGGEWSASLARQLANDEKRGKALAQWVQMGGHLIVSVSSNNTFVGNRTSFPLEAILPAQIEAGSTTKVDRLEGVRMFVENKLPKDKRSSGEDVRNFGAELAKLTLRSTAEPFASELAARHPSMVHAPYGLGRITLLAFDTDQGPFMLWANRRDFWGALLGLSYNAPTQQNQIYRYDMQTNDLTQRLRSQLEHFGEVRPIPFGWVALFIFVYILLVGPFDYLFLKKVVKWFTGHERLEWTWVTFPTVVLAVSLGAYFLAHYLKGDELRINKVDVIDVDPQRERVYGASWFTIFSPSLQHYDLGVEPVGVPGETQGMNVSWMGRPVDMDMFGRRSRSGTPSLFQRTYDFMDNGGTLNGVPINVWSMKTFTARWETAQPKSEPLFLADLLDDKKFLNGTVTSKLPVTLDDCRLVYQDRIWSLGKVAPNNKIDVGAIDRRSVQDLRTLTSGSGQIRSNSPAETFDLLRRATFYATTRRASSNNPMLEGENNAYLEFLDQTWRIQGFHEAILIGAMPTDKDDAVKVNDRQLLGSKFNPFKPALKGTMTQEVMVRVFLPVKVVRETTAQ